MKSLQRNDLRRVHAGVIIIPLQQQPRFESRVVEVSYSRMRILRNRMLLEAWTNPAETCSCSVRLTATRFAARCVNQSMDSHQER